jgi:hypothetical protein
MVHPSFKWAEVLGASDHGLLHVTVFNGDNPCNALALLDEARTAVEAAVRHTALLPTVEDDGHAVAFLVFVHDAADVQAASLVLPSSQDASGADSLSL